MIDLSKEIQKLYGVELTSGHELANRSQTIIPVSPQLNLALGGGILSGSWVGLVGKEKCGKTSLALSFASNAQKEEYGSRFCYYLNIEGRLKPRDINGIQGLDKDKISVIESRSGNILSAEKYLSIAENLIKNHPGCILIIDSESALCTESEYVESMDKMFRASTAKVMSKFCRKVSNILPVNDNIVININHVMANPSGYGSPYVEKGSNSTKYQTDFKLKAKSFKPWKDGDKQIGQEVKWLVVTSALGPPGMEVDSYIKYGIGIDNIYELMMLAMDCSVLQAKGAWITADEDLFGEKLNLQGKEKMYNWLLDNPDKYKVLEDKVRKIFL